MARDIRWALDALRGGEPQTAERILARAFEKYVLLRDGEENRLAQSDENV
jgi:hypothetical protein